MAQPSVRLKSFWMKKRSFPQTAHLTTIPPEANEADTSSGMDAPQCSQAKPSHGSPGV